MIDQTTGEWLLVWTIRLSVLCYAARLFISSELGWTTRIPTRTECGCWAIGCALYLFHVVCAFAFYHDWSHTNAIEHTAIETERITGVRQGEGLWVNYLFSIIWIADTIRLSNAWVRKQATHSFVDRTVHAFFAFIVFNATIVFGPPIYRCLGLVFALVLIALTRKARRSNASVDEGTVR